MSEPGVALLERRAPSEALVAGLGAERCDALGELLSRRAGAWVRSAFPAAEVIPVAGGLGAAVDAVAASGDGLVVVAPEVAVWRDDLGTAALDDLAAGCALSFGPVFDGGLYLVVLSAAGVVAVREDAALDLDGPAALSDLIALAERRGLEVGMLQAERGLRTAADARALAVDPLCDPELREALGD